ncbi:MAG: hypothetical protein AAF242_13915, partial [Bacteroidota bacterium]
VLSPSTKSYDMVEKLELYRKISSVGQIIYIHSKRLQVDSYQRIKDSNDWIIRTFEHQDQLMEILNNGAIKLEDLYKGVNFEDVST